MTTGVLGDHVLFSTHDAFTVEENTTSFTAHGTAGTLVARDCLTPQPVGTLDLVADGVASPVELAECHSLYEAVVDAFVNAVAGRGRPLAEGTDGQRSLTVALAAQLAASQGRAIAIPPEPAEASSKHVIVQPVEEEVS
jgi:1,5-anhydro-D-fructose reductase (1,5-anhydro-D-mannitol-forming)